MRAILVAIVFIAVGALAYAVFTGLSAVVVRNQIGAEANVTIFNGAQAVGSGRIADGGSDFFLFTAHSDGDIAITCRTNDQSATRTTHPGRVAVGQPAIYRITLGSCGRVTHYSADGLF